MAAADRRPPRASSPRSERPARASRGAWWLGASAATAGAWLLVRYLARTAAMDVAPLPWLSPPLDLLVSAGGSITRVTANGLWVVAAGTVACAAAATYAIVRHGRPDRRSRICATVFGASTLLALAFLTAQRPVPAAVAAAAAAVALVRHGRDAGTGKAPPARAWLLVPLALGFALRTADLMEKPPGYAEHAAVHHAELSIPLYEDLRLGVAHADTGALRRIWTAVVTDQHGPDSLVEALGFALFGVNMTATRLTSAVLGTLTILLAYGVGSRLAGPRAGLLFSFLIAVVPWHVSISRYEDTEHVLSPLHALLVLYFLFGSIRHGRWRDLLGLGVSLGLSWYLYSTNQALPLVAAAVGLAVLLGKRPFALRVNARALVAAAVFVAISVPAIHDFVQRGRLLPVRSSYEEDLNTSAFAPARLAQMARDEAGQLFLRANDPWFSAPGGGLGAVASVLLLPGLAWCASRLGDRGERAGAVLFLVGLPVSLAPAVLAPDASFRRLILFALLALLLSALVLDRAAGWLLSGPIRRPATLAILGLAAFAGTATSANAYFTLVHAYETESHRYDEAMARFTAARLGRQYVTVVAARDWDVDDVNRYLALAAHDKLRTLVGGTAGTRAVYCVVKPGDVASGLATPPVVDGRGVLIVPTSLVREPSQGVDLRGLVARCLPAARTSVWRARDGKELFTYWEYTAAARGPDGR